MASVTGRRLGAVAAPAISPWPSAAVATARLTSIDALRGLVMIVMLLDHVRETWFLYVPLGDPVDALIVSPASFFSRMTSMVCAPVFVALTGLGAYLYRQRHGVAETTSFLLKRGAFLVLLEFTIVNFAWRAEMPPRIVFLQVIWAIGLSMIALAALIRLPHRAILAIGLAIVCAHNLLDPISFAPGSPYYLPWGLIHERAVLVLGSVTIKFNYPVFPWIGVICLGWSIGPWFATLDPATRIRRLTLLGAGSLAGFVLLRATNVYGDTPWFAVPDAPIRTVMSFLALTKYPPSLLFLMLALGAGVLLLALFERIGPGPVSGWLAVLGGAPMFFYLLHLYVLRVLYLGAYAIWGPNHGEVFGVASIGWVWLWWIGLIVPLYLPTRWFSALKKRRKDIWWLKYL